MADLLSSIGIPSEIHLDSLVSLNTGSLSAVLAAIIKRLGQLEGHQADADHRISELDRNSKAVNTVAALIPSDQSSESAAALIAALSSKADASDLDELRAEIKRLEAEKAGHNYVAEMLLAKADATETTTECERLQREIDELRAELAQMRGSAGPEVTLQYLNGQLSKKAKLRDVSDAIAQCITKDDAEREFALLRADLARKSDSAPEQIDMMAALREQIASKVDANFVNHALEGKADVADLNRKANSDTMNAELAKKASIADVREALMTKADMEVISEELQRKADAAEVFALLANKLDRSDAAGLGSQDNRLAELADHRDHVHDEDLESSMSRHGSATGDSLANDVSLLAARVMELTRLVDAHGLEIRALTIGKADRGDVQKLQAEQAKDVETLRGLVDIVTDVRSVLQTKADGGSMKSLVGSLDKAMRDLALVQAEVKGLAAGRRRSTVNTDGTALSEGIQKTLVELEQQLHVLQAAKMDKQELADWQAQIEQHLAATRSIPREIQRQPSVDPKRFDALAGELERVKRDLSVRENADEDDLNARLDERMDLLRKELSAKADRTEIRKLEHTMRSNYEETEDRGAITRMPVQRCLSCDRALPRFKWGDTREVSIPTNAMPFTQQMMRPTTSPALLRRSPSPQPINPITHGLTPLTMPAFRSPASVTRSPSPPKLDRSMQMIYRPLLKGEFGLRGRDGVVYRGRSGDPMPAISPPPNSPQAQQRVSTTVAKTTTTTTTRQARFLLPNT
eukprot:TRINITY_DN1763_c0_g2_i1.p1 TRINITY_DN1763_c0_g2~~TRINITY_DN1763_c0_g2_i1.p1  ORF type:complete len:748 (+),score=214.13 TRINITY_DN1763_c0_g2_i1:37-2280(+)